ncbi:MAG TPA: DUF1501 domain-containing protein [Burkholderiaceae bacterium]|nr:DUF1501 domain-containing protein [Burkholderiaceae bacterium]
MSHSISRRALLRRAGLLGLAPAVAPFALNLAALGRATAATPGDYKALVCVFLMGGNDAYNTVLATDSASWTPYTNIRSAGSEPLALQPAGTQAQAGASDFNRQLGGVLPIAPARTQGRTFALHPSLGAVRDLFGEGRVGIVANVGPLIRPTAKADYANPGFPKPPKLFSHNDQQAVWQTFSSEGAHPGWGGRLSDMVMSGNQKSMFTAISLAGNAAWLTGDQARQYQLATTGSIHMGGQSALFGSSVVQQRLRTLASGARGSNLIEQDHAAVVARSIDADSILSTVLPAVGAGPWGTANLPPGAADPLLQFYNPDTRATETNALSQQLQAVARMISARGTLGMSRQVFFVTLEDFDTHDEQPRRHAANMARIAQAFKYFDNTLTTMGVGSDVTTFTASDFGRTFTTNGDGSDHGWGAHHFVMGGAVRGGDLYGAFPAYGVSDGHGGFTSPNQVAAGALLPTTSVDQYAATLGRWFGVADAELMTVLPNLANFDASVRNLGFLG